MKKIWGILVVTSLMLACNSNSEQGKNTAPESTSDQHEHGEEVSALVLNNGAKWKADSTTVVNAANLQSIIATAKSENLADYLQTSTALQEGLSKMVTECKMQGADHDALHEWLEPVMKKTKDLSKATATENAATTLHELEMQVNLFPQYFEK